MGLFQWIALRRDQQRINQLAMQISVAGQEGVWRRVVDQVFNLNATEARGYMRVRAAAVVQPYAQHQLADAKDLARNHGPHVVRQAIEQIVDRLSRRLVEMREAPRAYRRAA